MSEVSQRVNAPELSGRSPGGGGPARRCGPATGLRGAGTLWGPGGRLGARPSWPTPRGQFTQAGVPWPILGCRRTGRSRPVRLDAALAFLGVLVVVLRPLAAPELPSFDFTTPAGAQGWQALHDLSSLQQTAEGLRVQISGADPYFAGPARDYPAGVLLWLRLRLNSEQGGVCQVFYFRDAPSEANSVRFSVPAGRWHDAQVPIPALGTGYRLRIDPPGSGGACVFARVWFEERILLPQPAWPKPGPPSLGPDPLAIESGELKLVHARDTLGGFALDVAGQRMAVGHTSGLIGYLEGRELRWLSFGNCAGQPVTAQRLGEGLHVNSRCVDPDGARWDLQQVFTPLREGAIHVETRVSVDRDRSVVYLPLVTLLSGLGSFGTNKTQALLAGVEYLENEPSSSEADVIGPGARRQVPDTLKLTMPLMAVAAEGRYLGLIWEPRPNVCAVFDSPDRLFGSGGHLLGLLFPGSNGVNREEGNLLPDSAERLNANQPLILHATLLGGRGRSVVPAVQQYVKLRGLPPLPAPVASAQEYFRLAARGWLDSQIRQGHLYRHATPGFGAQPASDAACWMLWLAGRVDEPVLSARLSNAAASAIAQVAPRNYHNSQIGHVRYPLPALIYGAVLENAAQAQAHGRALLSRFQADGSVWYQAPPNGPDFGRTHWARDANGLTAGVVVGLLEAAIFSGDRSLIEAGLRHLRALDKFRDTVPRGAQTWEIPLHTPDILASAHLVRAYTLGYELTGEAGFLDQARYWAWTGVPFVYLSAPTDQPIGLYATIAVLGATHWTAPLWIGLPVQWCGLVYAEALHRFARHDPDGPWQQLADGITLSGVQQTYPATDANHLGLLPDSFNLRPQTRNAANINAGTVLAPAVRAYDQPLVYEFRSFRRHGLLVHAPGEVRDLVEHRDGVRFALATWAPGGSYLLVHGVRQPPRVQLNGKNLELRPPHLYQAAEGRLLLQVSGNPTVEIVHPPLANLNIHRTAAVNAIHVSWPVAAANFVLESRPDLSPASQWTVSRTTPWREGDLFIATEFATAPQKFFRLRQQP